MDVSANNILQELESIEKIALGYFEDQDKLPEFVIFDFIKFLVLFSFSSLLQNYLNLFSISNVIKKTIFFVPVNT